MKKLVLALGAVALLAAGCGDDDDDASTTTSTTAADATTTTETPLATTAPGLTVEDPVATARAWIDAIGAGDYDTVVALTSERSLAAFGGAEGVEENRTALAEGWGAWSHAEDLETATLPPIGDAAAVVVLHGQVAQEGPPREAWAALAVVATVDGDRVEPFLDLGAITVDPPAGTEVAAQPRFTITAPTGVQVQAVIDAGHSARVSQVASDEATTIEVAANVPLDPGLHVLTVVLRDGADIMVRTFEYAVEG